MSDSKTSSPSTRLNLILIVVAVFTAAASARAGGFAEVPLGLDAKEIVKLQYEALFSGLQAIDPDECVRGDAKPWFNEKTRSINSWYFKSAGLIRSVEAVVLDGRDALTIVNWGCEYYVVSMRYQFAEVPAVPSDRKWWYRKAARALRIVTELGTPRVFDLELCAGLLIKLSEQSPVPEEVLEVPVEGDGTGFLQTHLSVTGYGILPGKSGGYVELEMFVGPL